MLILATETQVTYLHNKVLRETRSNGEGITDRLGSKDKETCSNNKTGSTSNQN